MSIYPVCLGCCLAKCPNSVFNVKAVVDAYHEITKVRLKLYKVSFCQDTFTACCAAAGRREAGSVYYANVPLVTRLIMIKLNILLVTSPAWAGCTRLLYKLRPDQTPPPAPALASPDMPPLTALIFMTRSFYSNFSNPQNVEM